MLRQPDDSNLYISSSLLNLLAWDVSISRKDSATISLFSIWVVVVAGPMSVVVVGAGSARLEACCLIKLAVCVA